MREWLELYRHKVMVVYILGVFVQIIDGTIVNIAVPTLAEEFNVDSTDVDWAIIGFYLSLAVAIPMAGWLADRFGSKRMFMLALAGFVVSSTMCGAAQSLAQLVGFRIFQGLFAGLITPIGSAMLQRAFPLNERAKASTAIIGVVVVAPALGPVLGGAILRLLNWRWIFLINIPLGGLALFAAWLWLEEEIVGSDRKVDGAGLILAGGGLAALLFGISEGSNRGWDSPLILASLIGGLVTLFVMVLVENRVDDPVLALQLFKVRLFRATTVASWPAYAAFFAVIFMMPIFLQKVGDHSALKTAFVLLPQPLGVIIGSQLAGRRLYGRFGPKGLMVAGSILAWISSTYFAFIDQNTSLMLIGTALAVRGFAMGLMFVPIQTATYANVELPLMGRATSLFNTTRQAAGAAGVALVTTILSAKVFSLDSVADGGAPVLARVDAFQVAFMVAALLYGLSAIASMFINNEDAAATMVKS